MKKYECNDCSRIFSGLSQLKNHIKYGCPLLRMEVNVCPNPQNNPKCTISIKGNKTCKSYSLYGKKRPPEVGVKISQSRKGCPLSEDHKRKIKENANPYIRTEKHRKDASDRISGEKNYFYGKGDGQRGCKNHMYGKNLKTIWLEKYGFESGSEKWNQYIQEIKNRKSIINVDWNLFRNQYALDIRKYRRLVDRYVKRLDLSVLFGYSYRGTVAKNSNSWNLDHIISIKYGFNNNIDPKLIGSIENLRYVPWRVNNRKGSDITSNDNYDGHLNRISRELLIKWFGMPKLKKINEY